MAVNSNFPLSINIIKQIASCKGTGDLLYYIVRDVTLYEWLCMAVERILYSEMGDYDVRKGQSCYSDSGDGGN